MVERHGSGEGEAAAGAVGGVPAREGVVPVPRRRPGAQRGDGPGLPPAQEGDRRYGRAGGGRGEDAGAVGDFGGGGRDPVPTAGVEGRLRPQGHVPGPGPPPRRPPGHPPLLRAHPPARPADGRQGPPGQRDRHVGPGEPGVRAGAHADRLPPGEGRGEPGLGGPAAERGDPHGGGALCGVEVGRGEGEGGPRDVQASPLQDQV
mmetsp:Transcript_15993/g.40604  ORF Transcript_15993/g.40604 Transcript_15993/m.40604 type:complete len:204 (+) Transcript_15993:701-1312(+)